MRRGKKPRQVQDFSLPALVMPLPPAGGRIGIANPSLRGGGNRAPGEMVKRSRRDDLHNFKTQMTASSQTTSSNKKGTAAVLAAGFAAAFAPIVIAMMMAPPAEAYSSTYCTDTGNSVWCQTY